MQEEIKPTDWNGKKVIVYYIDGETEKGIQRGVSELGIIFEFPTDPELKDEFYYIPNSSIMKVQLYVKQPFEEDTKELDFYIKEN